MNNETSKRKKRIRMGNATSTREIKRTAKYSFPGGVVDDDGAESDEGGFGDDSNDDYRLWYWCWYW